ncbi:MAG: hypothetical protein NTV52_23435 [Acidobacteria bacterium]|nr:hypothetical protein [Acidobacteriota bacterium]
MIWFLYYSVFRAFLRYRMGELLSVPRSLSMPGESLLRELNRRSPASKFEAIYCISGFTDPNQSAQSLCLAMLHGLMKQNGVSLVIVHGAKATRTIGPARQEALLSGEVLHQTSSQRRGRGRAMTILIDLSSELERALRGRRPVNLELRQQRSGRPAAEVV